MKKEYQEILNKFKGMYPVPIENIAKALGYSIEYFNPNSPDTREISGTINYKKKLISINGTDSFYRQRFTTCHEVAHILNGDGEKFDSNNKGNQEENGIEIDFRKNIDGENKEIKEIRANQLAAELLMPKAEFIRKVKELKSIGRLRSAIIINLSAYFQASERAIAVRIDNLRLKV